MSLLSDEPRRLDAMVADCAAQLGFAPPQPGNARKSFEDAVRTVVMAEKLIVSGLGWP